MKKIKVMTVVGTRPEIIRLSRIIPLLDIYCDHVLVHTGQNYDFGLNQVFFEDLDIRKPDYFLESAEHSKPAAQTIGNIISSIDPILLKEKPEALLVLGDTNSSLCVITAKKKQIPIFHMEAGNRCFDERVPEETNRRIVDHIADINLTYSSIARECLLKEGLDADRVIKTGSPMLEVINHNMEKIQASKILSKLKIHKEKYFVISAHREESIESVESFSKLVNLINFLAENYNIPIIVSTHPRTRSRIETNGVKFHSMVIFIIRLVFMIIFVFNLTLRLFYLIAALLLRNHQY